MHTNAINNMWWRPAAAAKACGRLGTLVRVLLAVLAVFVVEEGADRLDIHVLMSCQE